MRRAALLLFALLALPASAADLPQGDPTVLGFDPQALAAIESRLAADVAAGKRAGYVAAVARDGKLAYATAVGFADVDSGRPMAVDTRFRIASMTKPITSAAVLMLVEKGRLLLEDPVQKYLPEFADVRVATAFDADESGAIPTEAPARPITVHQLLTHTAGLGYLFDRQSDLGRLYLERNLYAAQGDTAARVATLAELPLYFQPGERWQYSYATDVLGRLVEVVSGETLETFLAERLFEPLGMTHTEFHPDAAARAELATVYDFTESGQMVPAQGAGLLADPDAPAGWASGGGGLVSTANDYLRFLLMLLNGGELDGVRLLSPATVRLMLDNHVPAEKLPAYWRGHTGFGLGFAVVLDAGLTGRMASDGEVRWGGYYGTDFFASPADGVAAVLLTQREQSLRAPDTGAADAFRAMVYGALTR